VSRKTANKSWAEKQRQYRERRNADQARREQYLKKEQDKNPRDLKDGKQKLVSDMSARQLRKTREEWTELKIISRARIVSEQIDSVSFHFKVLHHVAALLIVQGHDRKPIYKK